MSVMKPYVGTPVSRVDGRAKVTGTAQYAAEFAARDLAYGAVVTSTIARGRITRIDKSRALAVDGVLDVLTHENRPAMASTDQGYNDDVAPGGSPFRPLYDDRIRFNGQPIALVSVAAAMEIEGGRIREARLALGGVAHKPWRKVEAETALRGAAPDRTAFAEAVIDRPGFRLAQIPGNPTTVPYFALSPACRSGLVQAQR